MRETWSTNKTYQVLIIFKSFCDGLADIMHQNSMFGCGFIQGVIHSGDVFLGRLGKRLWDVGITASLSVFLWGKVRSARFERWTANLNQSVRVRLLSSLYESHTVIHHAEGTACDLLSTSNTPFVAKSIPNFLWLHLLLKAGSKTAIGAKTDTTWFWFHMRFLDFISLLFSLAFIAFIHLDLKT